MRFRDFSGAQWRVLVILMLVNFVNYVDRQIIFSLFPALRRDFGLSFGQLGSLATAFTLVLALGSLPLGILADRISRRMVISAGVLFWSAATFFSGLAGSFRSLLAARALVGVGEAAYTPAGTAIISATFPREVRARVQGAFDVGMFIGGATGIALGGIVGQWLGWRPAFFLVGVPGLALGLSAMRLPETPHNPSEERLPVRELLRVPAYLVVLASGWFSSFAGYAYLTWGPHLVQEYKGFSPREAGVALGLTLVLSGISGILAGAWLSDRLARLRSWGRAAIVPMGFVLGAPPIFYALHSTDKPRFLAFFALGVFFLSWYHGPVTATIHDLIPPHGRATATGLYYLFVNLFAMALAPLLIGRIADNYGLLTALHVPLLAQLIGGALFLWVIYFIRRHGLHHAALAGHW
ncbi:MAG TPA: MFS transporter [Candidatus Acidoferrales bacterium]|nr:MFS transporter [Candidatus Acidoferrales bacterium]